jgi:nicotinamidase-related amidase
MPEFDLKKSKLLLLVVDMQNDFFRQHASLLARRSELVSAINRVTGAFRDRRLPVVWVRQEFQRDLSDGSLEMRTRRVGVTIAGTAGCEILSELERHPSERVIVKKRYSAFFRTVLDDLLAVVRPDALVIAGINTHACIRTTVIDAYQRDFEVVVVSDGVGSYDAEHDAVTRKYLDGKMARFMTSREIASMLGFAGVG